MEYTRKSPLSSLFPSGNDGGGGDGGGAGEDIGITAPQRANKFQKLIGSGMDRGQADPYIPIRTLTTPGDPWGPLGR